MSKKRQKENEEDRILSNYELDILLGLLNRLKSSQVSNDVYRTSKSLFNLVCELRFKTEDYPIIKID
jgi:hypothetical protein